MRGDSPSSVHQRTHRGCQLYGGNLKGLSKRHGSQLHKTNILFFMHDGGGFSRKVNSCPVQQTKLFQVMKKPIHSQPESHFNKYRVTGILCCLQKALRPMS